MAIDNHLTHDRGKDSPTAMAVGVMRGLRDR